MAGNVISMTGRTRSVTGGHRLAEKTWLDADGKATTDRVQGVTLLGPEGRVIPIEAARRAGLVEEKVREPEADKADAPAEKPKRRTSRSGDKARKAGEDK